MRLYVYTIDMACYIISNCAQTVAAGGFETAVEGAWTYKGRDIHT